jgi:hypothetical protein
VTADEEAKLRSLGADTPEQLLAQIEAAPAAFARCLGSDTAPRIKRRLRAMISSGTRTAPIAAPGPHGVPLAVGPDAPAPPRVDLEKRDALFAQLQQLKARDATAEYLRAVEQARDDLLDPPATLTGTRRATTSTPGRVR